MINSIQNIIKSRSSINNFQPNRPLDNAIITLLVDLATKAPTAYNLQNWRFIAVSSENHKDLLKAAAYGQKKISEASVSFIICGTLDAHMQLQKTLQPNLKANIMDHDDINSWVKQAETAYDGNLLLQRDEAIRSASLAAMTLMIAAEDLGLGTCAMGGFDAMQVIEKFKLSSEDLPVLIIAVGYPSTNNWNQKIRKPLDEILTIL
ncbi:nitroreductase family protein [Acinetobacter sp. AM]|uniref:nitroreductase family protein n=1 Tax=Acinetobacter sp. AM TaxID=2170730 RepID=UPI000DE78D7A|nr:nitroreductase family protein [Acinetobacter sp. AM]PWB13000.1 nitroreductase family protein [Acinetobacter sp. AM]